MDRRGGGLPGADSALTVRQLRIFSAVARNLNFTAAAQELYVAQPSISMAIADLERYLGRQLLVRTTRSVSLTADGRILRDLADRILWQLHEIETVMRGGDRTVSGDLIFGADHTCGTYVMPPLLGAFKTRYPAVNVQLEILNRPALQPKVIAHEYDLAVVSGPVEPDTLESFPFAPHELVIIAPPEHPLVARHRIPLRALVEHPVILREEGSGIRHAFEELLESVGVEMTPALSLGSSEAVKRAVQHRLGVAVASRLAIADELDARRLSVLDVEHFPLMRQWYLVSHREQASPPLSTLTRFLLDNVQHIVPDRNHLSEPP